MLLKTEKCPDMSEGRVDTQYIDLTNKNGVNVADTLAVPAQAQKR